MVIVKASHAVIPAKVGIWILGDARFPIKWGMTSKSRQRQVQKFKGDIANVAPFFSNHKKSPFESTHRNKKNARLIFLNTLYKAAFH